MADALYRYIADHFASTPAAEQARARMEATSPSGVEGRGSGRVELQVWSTLYGLWLGVAIPGALGVRRARAIRRGTSAGRVRRASSRARPSPAPGRSPKDRRAPSRSGGTWGTWQGLGWTNVFDIGEGYRATLDLCTNDGASEERFAGMIVGGLAGIGVGTLLSRRDISPGAATTANFGALWGTWFGFAGGYLMDLEDDDLLAATLLGGDAGLVGAALMAPAWRMSRSHARLVSIYGVMGGLAGLGVDLIVQPDNDKVVVAVPLVGSVVGLGHRRRRHTELRRTRRRPRGWRRAGSALLQVAHGRLDLGMPVPVPMRLDLEGARGRSPHAALGVTLLGMRFR